MNLAQAIIACCGAPVIALTIVTGIFGLTKSVSAEMRNPNEQADRKNTIGFVVALGFLLAVAILTLSVQWMVRLAA